MAEMLQHAMLTSNFRATELVYVCVRGVTRGISMGTKSYVCMDHISSRARFQRSGGSHVRLWIRRDYFLRILAVFFGHTLPRVSTHVLVERPRIVEPP